MFETSAASEGSTTDTPARPDRTGWTGRLAREIRRSFADPNDPPIGDFGFGDSPLGGDRAAGFTPLVGAIRVATIAVSLFLVSNRIISVGDQPSVFPGVSESNLLAALTVLVVVYAIVRTFRPIEYRNDFASLVRVLGEVALHVTVVCATGYWNSPLVFTLVTAVIVAGVARGFGFALRIGGASALAVSIPYLFTSAGDSEALVRAATWSGILVVVGITAGYARRVSGEADRERTLALDRLGRLADANALLFSLHRVTQTLPASLDLNDVLDSTLNRMRSLVEFDAVAVLLFDEMDGHWDVARHHGMHLPGRLGPTELPTGLRRAIAGNGLVVIHQLGQDGTGLSDRMGSGVYTTLSARGSIIGLLALEHRDLNHFGARDLELLDGFVAPAALAVDNARWFARLRTVGADEERTRIARDLHDRIGQSLAYLAFELDRIVEKHDSGEALDDSLAHLRDDVRGVIREVRDTLYDLRTDVSDTQSLGEVLEQYAARVAERSELRIQVDAETEHRLPILQEREMWRVAQEALANVERHAHATAVRVLWRCDGRRAVIDVTDNGVGFDHGRAGRLDSYGVLGMRERASSIGALLEIHSAPGRGTRVRCVLDPSAPNNSEQPR